MKHVIAYDIGTTGVKTCLFQIEEKIKMIASAQQGYDLFLMENGGVEQDEEQWWQAMCSTTKKLFEETDVKPEEVLGISFCSQMQGMVLVDIQGKALRRPMSYMDQRGKAEIKESLEHGIKVLGFNVFALLKNLRVNKAAPTSVKDPIWKYKWVKNNQPEIYKKIYKWLDVKEYLIGRCTGNYVMTEDSAYATFLYDTRPGKEGWNKELCKMYDVDMNHLPQIIKVTDEAGPLSGKAAEELGLREGTPVFGGGGDATLIGIGAGCVNVGETHIYSGTSGWVSTILDKQVVDLDAMIASIVGAQKGQFNYFAEMETAGKCLEWVKEHLALDEIGIYLNNHKDGKENTQETVNINLYDYLTETVRDVPPGAGGVIFTPWLHGNRCPFEDPNSAGMFFNIKLDTGKTELICAVLEGVCYHLRWMLECEDKKIKTSQTIRFVGGGALSQVTSQILANVTGRNIEVVYDSQNVGAVGAAATMEVGLGLIDGLENIKELIPVKEIFYPDPLKKKIYDKYYNTFKNLYKANKENFRALNQ